MQPKERKAFSLIARIGSLKHAFRGIKIFIQNTHNSWVEIFFSIIFILLGFYFSITSGEWLSLIIVIFVMIMAEAFNTAMEVHMDLTSPGEHPFARDTKDIAAGAVLISVFLTIITVLIIFAPYFNSFLAK